MVYTVGIRDIQDKPIAGAMLTFLSGTGAVLGTIRAGADGNVSVNDQQPGLSDAATTFTVSASGYKTDPGWQISDLDETVINRITMVAAPKTWLYMAGAAAVALVAFPGLTGGKKKVSGFLDSLTNGQKLGILAVGGLAAYYIFTKDNSGKKLPGSSKADLDALAAKGIVPTITATQAEAMSSSLTSAFAGCGTDEDTVYSTFSQLKNKADLLLLIYVYDVRSYQGCFEGMIWEESVTANLATALSNELSSSELGKVNDILHSNGIDFSF